MKTIALVTAVAATGHDEDLAPLLAACNAAGLRARIVAWDDATVSWGRFDLALLRSPWDYTERLGEFLAWCGRAQQVTALLNPLEVVRWNTDKHYLAELQAAGVPVVATVYVEPEAEPLEALQAFLASEAAAEFVVKPAVSAGARDTQRYSRAQDFGAGNHIAGLLEQGRSVMLQAYLDSVDSLGEVALVYFDGQFSHAINKGALLHPDQPATTTTHASGEISPRQADPCERQLAETVLSALASLLQLPAPPAYARIDLLRDHAGQPRLLELELIEPSLFFAHAPGSAERFAANLARHLNA
ncbi:MAG: hypothetical protein ABWY01_00095 [Pseudoxanthomonas sp.]